MGKSLANKASKIFLSVQINILLHFGPTFAGVKARSVL